MALEVSQEKVLAQARALAAPGPGGQKSLKELGYLALGVDDGWQACSEGVGGGFHDEFGYPLLNKTRFPDLHQLVDEVHQLGLKAGWYFNNCWCSIQELNAWLNVGGHPKQDVDFLVAHGFDAVKVDGCGPAHDISLWSQNVEAAERIIELENCANNGRFQWKRVNDDAPGWLPASKEDVMTGSFNLYRVSKDIAPQFYSTMYNLLSMKPFLEGNTPLSRPGKWAYPDMLQVANSNPRGFGKLSMIQSRTHFAAWCITSSPLVLGFDLTNQTLIEAAFPIISNERAISVNQAWAGHPGKLLRESQQHFEALASHYADNLCENGKPEKCTKMSFPLWQLWAKPLPAPGPAHAVLLINLSPRPQNLTLTLHDVDADWELATATEVWEGSEFEILESYSKEVASHDSIFFLLEPRASRATAILQ